MDGQTCEFPLTNATTDEIRDILATARTVAVVGLSDKPDRESYIVARYLQQHGYRIIPINPGISRVLGEPSYPDLASVPPDVAIDVVDVFRRPEYIPAVVDAAITRGARVVWMQLGLAHNAAAEKARSAGLRVVMDRCIKIEHARIAASG
jgi:predicted CoA-binding protein